MALVSEVKGGVGVRRGGLSYLVPSLARRGSATIFPGPERSDFDTRVNDLTAFRLKRGGVRYTCRARQQKG